MHSIDYLFCEAEEKLDLIHSMKVKCQQSNATSAQNLETIKDNINKSISYHIETLKIRGDWLKSHADHIFNLKKESSAAKFEQLENLAKQLETCLNKTRDNENEQEIRQTLTSALCHVDISEIPPVVSGLSTFTVDDKKLNESIISFGSISELYEEEETEDCDSGYILANMDDDDVEVLSCGSHFSATGTQNRATISETSNDRLCSTWVLSGKCSEKKIKNGNESQEITSTMSDWLMTNRSKEQTEECMEDCTPSQWLVRRNSSGCSSEDISNFVTKNNKIDSSFLLQRSVSSASNDKNWLSQTSLLDSDIKSFLHPTQSVLDKCNSDLQSYLLPANQGSQTNYKYPERAFLKHMDHLVRQDASKYLIERQATKLPFDDEKCQWLFKKGECSNENDECSKGSCEMFDKKWLKTINDW